MTEHELEKIIKESKELSDIRDEYKKTYQLLQEQRWNELQTHITDVMMKHPTEATLHNLVNPCMPNTIQQNAMNCMGFLETLFKGKLGVEIIDLTKYLLK